MTTRRFLDAASKEAPVKQAIAKSRPTTGRVNDDFFIRFLIRYYKSFGSDAKVERHDFSRHDTSKGFRIDSGLISLRIGSRNLSLRLI